MGRTRKFRGRITTLWHKCENCEKRESCMKADKDFTAKEILIDCEGFYYGNKISTNIRVFQPKCRNNAEVTYI